MPDDDMIGFGRILLLIIDKDIRLIIVGSDYVFQTFSLGLSGTCVLEQGKTKQAWKRQDRVAYVII